MLPKGLTRKGNNGGVRTGPRTKHILHAQAANGRSNSPQNGVVHEIREAGKHNLAGALGIIQNGPVALSNGIAMDGGSLEVGMIESALPSTSANGYAAVLPGEFTSVVAGPSVSMDSGSMGSPSRGSDAVMVNPGGPNSISRRIRHVESAVDDLESPENVDGKKKKRGPRSGGGEKGGRGLRHFSMKVCEKVESKGRTTYNEVADELVAEFTNPDSMLNTPDQQYDEKNIRRRVYDALNVLMAMDIISKERKEIQWKGLPSTGFNNMEQLKNERMCLRGRIEKKAAYLQELEEQTIGIENLVLRNESLFQGTGSIPANGVALPFILVQTRPHATVEVEISEDMQLVHFDFNCTPFELHDDAYVLKAMNFCDYPHSTSPDAPGHGESEWENTTFIEKDNSTVANYFQHSIPCHSPRAGSTPPYQLPCIPGKSSTSPPLPGILKARVKHENHT